MGNEVRRGAGPEAYLPSLAAAGALVHCLWRRKNPYESLQPFASPLSPSTDTAATSTKTAGAVENWRSNTFKARRLALPRALSPIEAPNA